MALKIYNTATRKKDDFNKKPGEEVTMYNCGLTVYERPQIGNLRAYTMADVMRRSLEFLGYKVKQVQNFTDVGHQTLTEEQKAKIGGEIEITDTDDGIDRMEKAAKKTGLTVWEVADLNIGVAMKDFHVMNFIEPEVRPRATGEIPEQIDLIKKLLEKGYAYITSTAIYYDTSKFENYGALSGQKQEDKKVAVREELEIDEEKMNPADFLLWEFDKPDHAMQWDFEYKGKNYRGYPGWHIECSAMAHKYLGNPVDIHTGGVDHIPVHHTNEIAQSEAAFGHPFVNYWYHNAFLTVDGKRMGKSLGNAYTLEDIEKHGFEPMDLRYFYLTADFRKPQNFSWEGLKSAQMGRLKLETTGIAYIVSQGEPAENPVKKDQYRKKFIEALEDSFNMPQALAVAHSVYGDPELPQSDQYELLKEFDKVLGLKLFETSVEDVISEDIKSQLEEIIAKRNQAKTAKDFSTADKLREEARALGFELEDTKDGTKYKKI